MQIPESPEASESRDSAPAAASHHSRWETEYRSILRTTLDAFWVSDLSGRFLDVNDAYCRTTGYGRDELLSMRISDVEAMETPDENLAHIAKVIALGFDRFESRHRRKDGTVLDVEVTATYLPDGEGKLIVFARDITERKRSERALRQSEARLRAHIENSPMAVIAWDSDFKVTQWSGEAEHMFGWTTAETLGRPLLDLRMIYPPDIPLVEQAMAKLTDGKSRYVVNENRNVTKDGRVVHCIWYNSNLLDDDGSMTSTLSQVLDVTERKDAEEALKWAKWEAERANDEKSRFLAAVSHDLRQPLSALSLYVGALEHKLKPADGQLIGNMKNCVAGLNEMLSNLLNLSQLEAGVVVPKASDFSIGAVLAKIASAHAPEARSKRLQLRCCCRDFVARTDPVLFQRIVGNLVSNAIRYTERGGVLVGHRRRGGKIWLEVWDTGVGIPADKTSEIFGEFKQLGNGERNRIKGTGLGLAIVAKTAALLGLEVRVRSWLGKGSMFAVELPLGKGVALAVEPQHPCRPLYIALVEDDALVAAALAYALGQLGHRLVTADSAEELMPQIDGEAPQLVISDYRLAGPETGLGVVAAVREKFGGELPAIIITGDTQPSLIRLAKEKGIRLLHKPLDIDTLQGVIAELVP